VNPTTERKQAMGQGILPLRSKVKEIIAKIYSVGFFE
jgi:hypothetical protein